MYKKLASFNREDHRHAVTNNPLGDEFIAVFENLDFEDDSVSLKTDEPVSIDMSELDELRKQQAERQAMFSRIDYE